MTQDSKLFILPRSKEGEPDHRFAVSAERILSELGADTIEDLLQFAKETESIQHRAASAGLKLAVAIFLEAKYLDEHHRYDQDNQYGWRSKLLRKQAQEILENIGFKHKNAHKLVASASWVSSQNLDKHEKAWMESLTPSHIYELSRMSSEGYALVKKEVSYPDFLFSAGQQEITVRRLEELRRLYPKHVIEQSKEAKSQHNAKVETAPSVTTRSEPTLLEAVPEMVDTPIAVPATDPVQDGIRMLIESLGLIGSIDDLALSDHYLEQLKPYGMTLGILVDILGSRATVKWRR